MNLIFSRCRIQIFSVEPVFVLVGLFVVMACAPILARARPLQTANDPAAEFKRISRDLSTARQSGGDESQSQMEKALAYLDSFALAILNGGANPDLDEANRKLAGFASETPTVGENYRLVKLGGAPAPHALLVNFGLGGPAAVRIYANSGGAYALAGKIDRFTQKDFFDSDVELVPVSKTEPVFVTISGRTDDLSTGMFSAWRLDGNRLAALWTSELLQQSNYEDDDAGFHLVYCSQPDDDHPSECLKMSRDLYRYQGGEWKRVEMAELPVTKPAGK